MELAEGSVYCDVHGDIHDACVRPYDGTPTERDEDGNPVWLRYADFDEDGNEVKGRYGEKRKVETRTVPMEPDCTAANWHKLWIGALLG